MIESYLYGMAPIIEWHQLYKRCRRQLLGEGSLYNTAKNGVFIHARGNFIN